jgi:hypothetical protein
MTHIWHNRYLLNDTNVLNWFGSTKQQKESWGVHNPLWVFLL